MKIGLVLSKTPNYSETFFLSKIEGLQASGFKVTLFVQKNDNHFSLCDVVLASNSSDYSRLFNTLKGVLVIFKLLIIVPVRLTRFIRLERQYGRAWGQIFKNIYSNAHILTSKVDWLHFGFATIALQSEHVAKAIQAKMAVSFRGFDLDVYPEKNPNCYDILWKQVDKVHAISKYMLHKAYSLGLSKETLFEIITPAIDSQKFKSESKAKNGSWHFLTVGRLHPIKGLSDSIKAISILRDQKIDCKYTIVGNGPEYEFLTSLISELGLVDRIILKGKLSHAEIVHCMNEADLYIQYSISEGFCNATLEAQAMKLLCVVSDGGALPENILHQQTGWVVLKKNPVLLAETIAKVINLPKSQLDLIRNKARERVENEFTLKQQQQAFKEFYMGNLDSN